MEERLHKALGEFVKLAKRGGYTEGQILALVRKSLLHYCHEQPILQDAEECKVNKENYMQDVFAFSISKKEGSPTRPKMERALRVMYILHTNEYAQYSDFRAAISDELGMSPQRVDTAIAGVNSLLLSVAFMIEAYAKDMKSRWVNGSYQDRLNILEVIEQRLYDDLEKKLESG